MAFPENKVLVLPATVTVGAHARTEVRQMTEKAYDFTRDAGAVFQGFLQGSVAGRNWTNIVTLAATAQGIVPAHYNLVRVNCPTTPGAAGAATRLVVSGKVL